jgi:hypothetical protein
MPAFIYKTGTITLICSDLRVSYGSIENLESLKAVSLFSIYPCNWKHVGIIASVFPGNYFLSLMKLNQPDNQILILIFHITTKFNCCLNFDNII